MIENITENITENINKNSLQLKAEAESYLWKYKGNDDDMKRAEEIFLEAIEKNSIDKVLSNVQLADCYARISLTYKNRDLKEEHDFQKAFDSCTKIFSINLPSWYNRSDVISLLIRPEQFGFDVKYKDFEKAKTFNSLLMDSGCLYQVACAWAGKDDVNEEELYFAEKYFDIIIERNIDYNHNTVAMAHCRLAMIYAYNKDKNKINYDKSIEHFTKSINYNGFIEHGLDQVSIPFCQLSILLSNASDFGFPKEYENIELSKSYISQMEIHASKNPALLWCKAGECYQFHKFANESYFTIAEKYYNLTLESCKNMDINNNKLNIKIITTHYIASIYTKNKEKSLENYFKAINNHLETINLALDVNGKGDYVHNVTISSLESLLLLLNEPQLFNYNKLYSKSAKAIECRKHISDMQEQFTYYKMEFLHKVLDIYNKVHNIELKNNDIIFNKRQNSVIHKNINANDENKDEHEEELNKLIITKKNLSKIQENQILYEYYDGFLRTFVQVYAVSVIIKSGQLSLDTSNIGITLSTKLVSLIPLIGEHISSGANALWDFMKSMEMVNKATNVVKFSTTSEQFDELVQDVLISIINKNSEKIIKISETSEEMSELWYEKIKKFCTNMKVKIEETGWVQELETPMQKLGSKDATKLIADYLSNGKIYGKELAIRIPINDKRSRLLEYAIIITNEETVDINTVVIDGAINSSHTENIMTQSICCPYKWFFSF